jgi:hypothetical protein
MNVIEEKDALNVIMQVCGLDAERAKAVFAHPDARWRTKLSDEAEFIAYTLIVESIMRCCNFTCEGAMSSYRHVGTRWQMSNRPEHAPSEMVRILTALPIMQLTLAAVASAVPAASVASVASVAGVARE